MGTGVSIYRISTTVIRNDESDYSDLLCKCNRIPTFFSLYPYNTIIYYLFLRKKINPLDQLVHLCLTPYKAYT